MFVPKYSSRFPIPSIRPREVADSVLQLGELDLIDCRHQYRNIDLTLNLAFHVWPNAQSSGAFTRPTASAC